MAEWLCRGLQILRYRFDSGFGLQRLFRDSSAVEQSAVNRLVVGSNPTRGANNKTCFHAGFFVVKNQQAKTESEYVDIWRTFGISLNNVV